MPKNDPPAIHTVFRRDRWFNEREGQSRAIKGFDSKTAAQAAGRKTAQHDKAEHVIHNKDGSVGQKNSYGDDPRSSKG